MNSILRHTLALVCVGLTIANPSLGAQADIVTDEATTDASSPPAADGSTIVYEESFFAEYNLRTADEMLQRIPGGARMLDSADSGGGQQRGFGSEGDQILINGRRLAGKSNEISAALRRIRIENVDRIELLRGTSNDIDVRSEGVVINIVLKEREATTHSGSATVKARLDDSGRSELDGDVSYNGELGKLTYFLSLDKNSFSEEFFGGFSRREAEERYFFATGELQQFRAIETERNLDEVTFAANSTYDFESDERLQLNILVKPVESDEPDVTRFTAYDIDGAEVSSGVELRNRIVDSSLEWEFGGSYEHGISDDGNLKVLWVYTHNDTESEDTRGILNGDGVDEVSRYPSEVLQTEAILRGSYFWPLTANQTLELGGEVARNLHEQTIQAFFDFNGDGVAEEIEIFDPSSKVEELRSEIFANHNWTLSERWTAATSLVAEHSEITQRGVDINNKTRFRFMKPRVDLRYAPDPSDQLRIRIERTVSQLNFSNFVPRYDIRTERFTAGNPYIRPETAWEYELGFEHRLPDDQGVVDLRTFFNDIEDRIESVAIDLDGDGDFENAPGNIGDGTEYGFELSLSLRMTRLGAPNLIIDASYLWRDSSIVDPFTGIERNMATREDYLVNLGIRHDVPARRLAYGVSYEHQGGPFARYDWQERRWYIRQPQVSLFVDKKLGSRWTFRVDAIGLTGNEIERTRLIYADDASVGTLGRREFFEEVRDRRYTVSLTATF